MANTLKNSKATLGAQVKKPRFDNSLFEAGVIGALKQFERGITDESSEVVTSTAREEAIELFQISREYAPLEELGTAVDAIQAFTEWLASDEYSYKEPVYFMPTSFTVQITVPNGTPNSSSTFQLHCNAIYGETYDKAIDAAYKYLANIVQTTFKPVKRNEPVNKQSEKETDMDVPFDALRCEKFQGKLVYRLMPTEGRWKQHGVALYRDEARKAGIDLKEYAAEGDYELSGNGCIEYKPDGKPARWKDIDLE